MRTMTRIVVALLGLALLPGCSNKKDDGTAPIAEQKSLPTLAIREDTPDLMLTWIDEQGDTHVGIHPSEVPAASRAPVRVVVADRADGTLDQFYVVDLGKKRDDGSFAAETMSRRAWEARSRSGARPTSPRSRRLRRLRRCCRAATPGPVSPRLPRSPRGRRRAR
jgi:hypothetical protein